MDMIFRAAGNDWRHLILPRNAAQKRPESLLQRRGNEWTPFFGAENAVETGTDVRHAAIQPSLRDLGNSGLYPAVNCRAISNYP